MLQGEIEDKSDSFLEKLKSELDELEPKSTIGIAKYWSPKGQIMTRDMVARGQGIQIPPHIELLAEITAIGHSFGICKRAAEITTKAASHLERRNRKKRATDRVGTNVFIGHGRSSDWRVLKDFIAGSTWPSLGRV